MALLVPNTNVKNIDGVIRLDEFDTSTLAAPTPPADQIYFYAVDEDGETVFKYKNSSGTESNIGNDLTNITKTWNNAGTIFNGIKLNVTDTASHANSKLLDLQSGGTSQFSVSKVGVVTSFAAINGASPTEMSYLSGVTSGIQAQLDAGGGGAFTADGDTLITPVTPIVLNQATGDEAALTLDYTVNKATSGNDTGLLINMTDTLSPGTSYPLDVQLGGVSKFSVDRSGNAFAEVVTAAASLRIGSVNYRLEVSGTELDFYVNSTGSAQMVLAKNAGMRVGSTSYMGWASSTAPQSSSVDTTIYRDAADTVGQRRSTNAQTFNIYNTYTDASNYERGFISWNDTANTFVIGTEVGGTGTARDLEFSSATGSIRAYNAAHTQQRFFLNHNANTPSIKLSQSTGKTATYTPIWLAASDDYTISSTAGNLIGINPGVSITQGTLTDDKQAIDITSTWSDVADTFTLIKADVTDTASAAGSLLMDLQVASSGVFQVSKAGGPGFYGSAPVAQAAHIADPTGGATTDAEARTAINAILVALENIGITAVS